MVKISPVMGRRGKRRQLMVAVPQYLGNRLQLATTIYSVLNLNFSKLAAFPASRKHHFFKKKYKKIGWGLQVNK